MSVSVLIAIGFSLGFFFESVFGFGGSLIAYAVLGFFIDLKQMVLAALYIGTCSSAYIAYSDLKSVDKKIFKSFAPLALVGTILGVLLFSKLSSKALSPILGSLLIVLALKTIFFDQFSLPKILRNKLVFVSGIVHGAFGIGGAFLVNAIKDDFRNKSALRSTMAAFFMVFNFIRIAQLGIQGEIDPHFFQSILWVIIPVFLAVKFGHKVHLKISDNFFKKGIGIITLATGIKFLF